MLGVERPLLLLSEAQSLQAEERCHGNKAQWHWGMQKRNHTQCPCTLLRFVQTSGLAVAHVSHTFQCPRNRVNHLPVRWQLLLFRLMLPELLLLAFLRGSLTQVLGASTREGSEWKWSRRVRVTAVRGIIIVKSSCICIEVHPSSHFCLQCLLLSSCLK